jgi:hypothetical protein
MIPYGASGYALIRTVPGIIYNAIVPPIQRRTIILLRFGTPICASLFIIGKIKQQHIIVIKCKSSRLIIYNNVINFSLQLAGIFF